MTTRRLPSRGEVFTATVSNLATAYGLTESEVSQRVYAMAEQIHRHYCLSRGIVNHAEARPDQHVAVSVLSALAGSDWWMVRADERKVEPLVEVTTAAFLNYGDDTVNGAWSDAEEGG